MRDNENVFALSGILLIITAVVALMLSLANSVTADKIAENTLKAETEARKAVMSEATDFKLDNSFEEGIVKEIYTAVSGDTPLGWCVSVAPNGYGGAVEFIVGIDEAYNITGIKIVNMSETAGLGAKAKEEKFLSQLVGKKAENGLSVIKSGTPADDEILAISGATVTTEAIKSGINAAVEKVKEAE